MVGDEIKPGLWSRLSFIPVWIAYRLIWLSALLRNDDAEDVYQTMWSQYLDLPRIPRLTMGFDGDCGEDGDA